VTEEPLVDRQRDGRRYGLGDRKKGSRESETKTLEAGVLNLRGRVSRRATSSLLSTASGIVGKAWPGDKKQ